MPRIHAHLLINVRSRQSRSKLKRLHTQLTSQGVYIDKEYAINRRNPLDSVIKTVLQDKPTLLLVGGGDGTISSVMDHLADSEIVLGLIPLGTTNNCARSLNIPLEPSAAIAKIINGKQQAVDLGSIDTDHFTNVAGIGLSALIAKRITNKTKRRFGRLAYAIVGGWTLLTHRPFRVTMHDHNGDFTVHLETHQLIIANGSYHAGRKIAADAALNNRELVIFPLGGRSRLSLLWRTFDFYYGRRKKIAHAYYMRGNDVTVHTSIRQLVELDGEPRQSTPVRARVDTKAIRVRF